MSGNAKEREFPCLCREYMQAKNVKECFCMAVKKAVAPVNGRSYLIVNKKSGKALSAEAGADKGGVG